MIKSFIFFFFSSFSFTSSSSDCDHSLCSLQIPLFSWIRENKGYIHDDLILSNGFNILKPLRGLYSINNIEDDKVLIEIPSKIQLCAPNRCLLIQRVLKEIQLEKESFWWPYLSIIINDEIDIPAIWTADELSYLKGLQPGNWRSHLSWFRDTCHGDIAESLQLQVMLLVVTRARGDSFHLCLNPLFDHVLHSYITQANTFFHIINTTDDPSIWIQTSNRMINKYELLTNSYGNEDSGRLFHDYGLIVTTNEPSEWQFIDSSGEILYYGLIPIENNEIELVIPQGIDLERFYTLIHSHLHFILSNPPPNLPIHDEEYEDIEETNSFLGQKNHKNLITKVTTATITTTNKMNQFTKVKKKRLLNANLYRFHYVKSLQIASNEVEKLFEIKKRQIDQEL